jgi:hypothetical protein
MTALSNVGINNWHIKRMVGKKLTSDISTYLRGIDLKADFKRAQTKLRLTGIQNGNQVVEMKQMLDTVMEVLRSLVEDRLKEKGLMRMTKPTDWDTIYQKLLPESEKREKVMFT